MARTAIVDRKVDQGATGSELQSDADTALAIVALVVIVGAAVVVGGAVTLSLLAVL